MVVMERPGASSTARFVHDQIARCGRELNESAFFGRSSVADELTRVFEECSKPDWDGYGALPVSWDGYLKARQFLRGIPFSVPAPSSVGAEPDGHLTFEWSRSRRRTLSVSVSPEGELHYAAILGPNRAYGTELFFGEVPDAILKLVGRVYA